MGSKNIPLPNKPVVFILLVCFIAIISVALIVRYVSSRQETREQESGVAASAPSTTAYQGDDDNDGLENWEEELWGTNPNDPDTDSDGTTDGMEVNMGRSPTTPGPGDRLHLVSATTSTEVNATSSRSATQTALFAQTFISTYLNTKLYGGSFNSQADTLTAIALPELGVITQHSPAELTITTNTSKPVIHAYGNTVGGILKKNAPGVANELVLMLQAMHENDVSYLTDLPRTVTAYKKNALELLSITVPTDIQAQHLTLINSFLLVARDIDAMRLVFEDPLTSLAGFRSYIVSSENLTTVLESLRVYLSDNTTYQETENGYILTSSI